MTEPKGIPFVDLVTPHVELENELLDAIIPFSSVILLGVVVAVEDHYAIRITRESLANTCTGGTTLRKLALMVQSLQHGKVN